MVWEGKDRDRRSSPIPIQACPVSGVRVSKLTEVAPNRIAEGKGGRREADLKEAGVNRGPDEQDRIQGPGPWDEPAKYGEARKLPGRGGGYMEALGVPILVARAAGGKSWAYQALTWAGWPRLEGGPGHHLVPSRIPPARPGPPTNRREVSIPRPMRGGLSGRRGRRIACTGVFAGPPAIAG